MLRRGLNLLLNLVTLCSLLLCVAATAMWARSYLVREVWVLPVRYEPAAAGEKLLASAQGWQFVTSVGSGDGRLVWFHARRYDYRHRSGRVPPPAGYQRDMKQLPRGVDSLGGTHGSSVSRHVTLPWFGEVTRLPRQQVRMHPPPNEALVSYGGQWCVHVYWWVLAATSAILPLVRGSRAVSRARRRARGLCPRCGYDLTGNVSGVCPECGAAGGAPRQGEAGWSPVV